MGERGVSVCLSICLSCLQQTGKLMEAFWAGLEMTRLLPECSQVRVLGRLGGGGGRGVGERGVSIYLSIYLSV